MSSKAISAQALGGEADTIAVASPLHPHDAPPSTVAPAATAMISTATPSADPKASDTPSASVLDLLPDPASAASALAPPSTLPSASGPDRTATGLHSPPDSNNASKLDGSSSDSELSDLDDDALAETFRGLQSDVAGAAATSVTTPVAAAADTVPSAADAAPSAAPCPSTTPLSEDASTAAEEDDIGEIEPDHYSGTVPVFRPTMHQFRDFKKFMGKIDKYGMKSGIVKIIPPQEWKDSLDPLDELVKPIKVREPIKQDIMGSNGTYRQVNMLHQRTYNLPQWRQLCDQSEHQPPARRGERRANADKPKPAPRARATAAAGTAKATAATGAGVSGKKGKRGRGGRKGARTQRHTADDDTASVVSEPRPMTPESQRGDDEKMVLDDDKTCVETPQDTDKHNEDKAEDDNAVLSSVEVEFPIKREEDDDDAKTADSTMTDIPTAPRRMGFTRQSAAKTQSTSARRKYSKREGSAKIDEAAFKDWDYRMDVSDYTPERCGELERTYWKTLTYAPPLYGADLPGTLFNESTELWNLNKLPNLLDVLGTKVPGVNTAYLYLGMWKATFAWHLEDVDLYSINYLHFGAPKQWYSISQGDARRFEAAMKNIWPADAKACDQFLRHKAFLISPSHLQNHYNIRVNKCVSYPGEFVVTYPYGYHSGYNLGYNCAEAVNFALESWLPMGKIAKKCECAQAQDSVWVDVYEIERKLRGISTEDEEDSDEDEDEEDSEDDGQDGSVAGLPTPPSGRRSHRVHFPKNAMRKRPLKPMTKRPRARADVDDADDDGAGRRLKKMRLRLWSGEDAPCCLCPNDLPDAELLPTNDGREAHRMCALYLPETYIEEVDGKEVVTNIENIQMPRMELRCMYCRLRKGVCLQCSHAKCTRSYHATCAAAAGVFVEEVEVPVFGNDGTEYKERAFEFICRFQRIKRDKKLDSLGLEKSERIRTAAAALKKGAVCQMQLYRSDIFAGIVVENRPDEETLLLHVIPSGEEVEVDWKWLLLPDAADYRLPKASPNALPLPTSRKEIEGLNVQKRPFPLAGDVFVEGFTWKEFHICEGSSFAPAKNQAKVDLSEANQLWHYIGKLSTDAKAQYTDDPSNPVHHRGSNFLESLPIPVQTLSDMLPPQRPSLPPTPVPIPAHAFALPLTSLLSSGFQLSGQTAGQPGAQPSAEPRRSYSVIKPPYVPHTSPTTLAPPAPSSSALSIFEGDANKFRKTSDGFVQPQRPASRQHQPGGHRHHHHSSPSNQPSPFGSFFSMPKPGGASSKFPQIQHPNLSHGYATVPMAKPQSTAGGAMSPPSGSTSSGENGGEPKFLAPSHPRVAILQTSTNMKYPFFQVHGNRDASNYRSPYLANGGFSNNRENINSSNGGMRAPRRKRKSSSGAASLAAAAAKLHKRSASSMSSASSFDLGGGLKGLSRPSSHTNYVGPPPQPSSTASSPFWSANNMNFDTRPGSSVSSYASYESIMGGGPGMSPHSPAAVDASPFIGSPGPQMGAFDFSAPSSSTAYHHPGIRPQFGASWQQNFHAPLGSFAQEMDINFSPLSPMSSVIGLPGGGLGAPANIIPGHQQSISFGGPSTLGADSMLMGGFGGFGTMSPPLLPESPMAMSPTLDMAPPDAGTSQSPAEQLKQQLRSISDSSLPSSYRLRCLHQPRRRHQSRSSLNRIYTSQLLDLNPT